jgi:hypothetical protein
VIRLEPGKSGDIVWKFTNDGVVKIACLVPGHCDAGMHDDVTVANKLGGRGPEMRTIIKLAAAAALTLTSAAGAFAQEFTNGAVKKVDAKAKKVTRSTES